jgi:hypothetical protein
MQFYLSQAGQQSGPFLLFQLKEMLDRGEITVGVMAWHQGLQEWCPLGQLEAMRPYLSTDKTQPDPQQERVAAPTLPPPLPEAAPRVTPPLDASTGLPLRRGAVAVILREGLPRLMARVFDVYCTWLLFIILGLTVGVIEMWQIGVLNYDLAHKMAAAALWIFGEAWFVSRLGTTPGKWLFGLKVENVGNTNKHPAAERTRPSWRQALNRSASVWFRGWGLGLHPMIIFMLSLFTLPSLIHAGQTPWDFLHRTRVAGRTSIVMGSFFFLLIFLVGLIVSGVAAQTAPPESHPAYHGWKEQQREIQQRTESWLRWMEGVKP